MTTIPVGDGLAPLIRAQIELVRRYRGSNPWYPLTKESGERMYAFISAQLAQSMAPS